MSSSSEIVDSGTFSGQNMPLRYPQNSSFPYLTLGMRGPPDATMNLFPMVGAPRGAATQKQEDESRTMTIFYNGQVIVFGDLGPEKVREILKLAARKAPKLDEPSKNMVVSGSGLPIARRNSIARFFEKRKDRITARSPYQAKNVSKQDDNKSWLGLGRQSY